MVKLTQILHDVVLLQILEQLNLTLQSVEHLLLSLFVGRDARGDVDLLDGHEQPPAGVHAEEDRTEGAGSNECSLDPLEGALA
jgi:hypothetical protein